MDKTATVKVLDKESGEYVYLGVIDDGTNKTSRGTCYLGYFRFLEIDKSKLNNEDSRRLMIDSSDYAYCVDYQIRFHKTYDHTFNVTKSSYICEPINGSIKIVDKNTGKVKILGNWEE